MASLSALGQLWLQNLILAATATIGLLTIRASSRSEKRRATVDVVLSSLSDNNVDYALTRLADLLEAGLDIPFLLSERGVVDRRTICAVLNRYEFMASGVREGAFDDLVFQRMYHGNVTGDWHNLYDFIQAFRKFKGRDTIFQDLEELVKRWESHPLKPIDPKKRMKPAPRRPST